MRPLVIVGALAIAGGAFLLIRGGSFTTERTVLDVGSVEVSTDQRRTIPPWVGGVAVVAGLVMVVAGMQKRA